MNRGARGAEAARAAAVGFLASIGFIAILTWFPARYLADWAVYPIDLFTPDPSGADVMSAFEHLEMSKWDFRNALAGAAVTLGWLVALYWLAAYLIGAARLGSRPRLSAFDPSVLLAAGLVSGMGIAFISAAPRFVTGPLIDACTRRYEANHSEMRFSSAGIHGCEARVGLWLMAVYVLLVVGLIGASLWRRYRLRATGDPA